MRCMSKLLAAALPAVVIGGAAGTSHAALITGVYTFDTEFGFPTQTGLTFSPFSRVGVNTNAGTGVFNSRDWNTGSSIDLAEYVEFTVTPDAGYEMDLSSITFGSQRSSTGPATGQVRFSVDGFTSNLSYTPPTAIANSTWDFADVNNTTSPVTFRFYGFGGTSAAGTLRFDNVALAGDISPVPEPAVVGSFALAAGLMSAQRRRRRTAK